MNRCGTSDRLPAVQPKRLANGKPGQAAIELLRDLAGPDLTPIGVAPLPKEPVLIRQVHSAPFDWVLLRLEEDPRYRRKELNIPRSQRRRLARLDRLGVVFDELLIAHEVPKEVAAKTDSAGNVDVEAALPPLPPAPKSRSQSALEMWFKTVGIGAGVVLAAPLALLAAPLALFADPVLLGAVTSDGSRVPGTPAAFFMIARW